MRGSMFIVVLSPRRLDVKKEKGKWKMRTIKKQELLEILQLHMLWLRDEKGGVRANLRYADLRYANLQNADLRNADLVYADLRYTDLRNANLRYANLGNADLRYANLGNADLVYADLQNADLRYADLRYADLRYANLQNADLRYADLQNAVGQNNWIKTLGSEIWSITYTFDRMQIGCENHLITDWWQFDEERISRMNSGALDFWKRWKPILQEIIKNNPAQATGKEN